MQSAVVRRRVAVLFALLACLASFAPGADGDEKKARSAGVFAVAFSGDGQTLASISGDNNVKLWDVSTRRPLTILGRETGVLSSIALSSDGRNLAAGSHEGEIAIWDSSPGEPPTVLTGHRGTVKCLAYSSTDVWLASGGADRTIRVWRGRRLHKVLEGHARGVLCLAFSSSGQMLASGSADETVKIWDVERGSEQTPASLRERHKQGAIVSVAFSPDGTNLAIATADSVQVWDLAHGQKQLHLKQPHEGAVWWGVRYSPKGTLVAVGSGAKYEHAVRVNAKHGVSTGSHRPEDHEIWLWDVQAAHVIARLRGHQDSVRTVSLSTDGVSLAAGSKDQTLRIWDIRRTQAPKSRPTILRAIAAAAQPPAATDPAAGAQQPAPMSEDKGAADKTATDETAAIEASEEAVQAVQQGVQSSHIFDPTPAGNTPDSNGPLPTLTDTSAPANCDGAYASWGDLLSIELAFSSAPMGGATPNQGGHTAPIGSSALPKTVSSESTSVTSAPSSAGFRSTATGSSTAGDAAGWGRRESYAPASSGFWRLPSGSGSGHGRWAEDDDNDQGGKGGGDGHKKK